MEEYHPIDKHQDLSIIVILRRKNRVKELMQYQNIVTLAIYIIRRVEIEAEVKVDQ